ncbi:MAG: nucleotidyltransferase family protein [Actinomycetota bacterium]
MTYAEQALVIECAKVRPAGIGALAGKVADWETVLRTARSHAVVPLLYTALAEAGPDAVPADSLTKLRGEFESNSRRNLEMTGELMQILDLLEGDRIEAVPYKGPAAAQSLYGNLAMRQFTDLDFLLLPRDVPRARATLETHGFVSNPVTATHERALIRSWNEMPFTKGKLIVELQWRAAPSYFASPVALEPMWSRLANAKIGGREVPSLSPEDLLLVLSIHGAKHTWERMSWIADIARIRNAFPKMDFELASRRASAAGVRRMLRLAIFLASDLLHAEIPAEIVADARSDPAVTRLADRIRHRLFSSPRRTDEDFPFEPMHLEMLDRPADRARYIAGLAFTPTAGDWETVSLTSPLSFLYYLLRPFRLAAKHLFRSKRASRSSRRIGIPTPSEDRGAR